MKITIITVTFEDEHGLRNTIKSVRNQSYQNFELIVIDGGSTYDVQDCAKELIKDVKLVSEPDAGIYDAMNKGLDLATGEYVIFLNGGDLFYENSILEHVADALMKEKPDFLYGDSVEYRGKNQSFQKVARHHKHFLSTMFAHHQSMFFNINIINNISLRYDITFKIAADYDFVVRYLRRAEVAYYLPKSICIFEGNGLSQTNALAGRREQMIIRRRNTNLVHSLLIFSVQSMVFRLRAVSPRVYWLAHKVISKNGR